MWHLKGAIRNFSQDFETIYHKIYIYDVLKVWRILWYLHFRLKDFSIEIVSLFMFYILPRFLPLIFPLKLIYSQIFFFSYTKYFVLTFSIDVVSTLSNQSYGILSLGEIGPRQNSAGKVGYSASTLTPFFMSSTQIWRFLTLRFVTGRHCTINSKLFGACWNTGGVPPTTIFNPLNHKAWWPTHASVNSVIIGTGNRQYSVGPLGINCTYILMEIHKWPFKKYKIPPAK